MAAPAMTLAALVLMFGAACAVSFGLISLIVRWLFR
jgi:hypothetical protein